MRRKSIFATTILLASIFLISACAEIKQPHDMEGSVLGYNVEYSRSSNGELNLLISNTKIYQRDLSDLTPEQVCFLLYDAETANQGGTTICSDGGQLSAEIHSPTEVDPWIRLAKAKVIVGGVDYWYECRAMTSSEPLYLSELSLSESISASGGCSFDGSGLPNPELPKEPQREDAFRGIEF
jgi:hypothetical protein